MTINISVTSSFKLVNLADFRFILMSKEDATVQSINDQIDLTTKAALYLGTMQYGHIQIGEHGFEFFNQQRHRNFIQLPWADIEQVIVEVSLIGKRVSRFTVIERSHMQYVFVTKDAKKVLRGMRPYIGAERLLHAPSLLHTLKRKYIDPFL